MDRTTNFEHKSCESENEIQEWLLHTIGKHAAHDEFEMFLRWVDSGDPSLHHYLTGESEAELAIVLTFPSQEAQTEEPTYLQAVAGH